MAEEETGETRDLTQEYLDEDPSVLTEEEFQKIADVYGISIEKVKTIAKQMTKLRQEVKEQNG